MLGEKRIKANLFGEEIILDYGIRFSARLRELYPNFQEYAESNDVTKIMIMSVAAALPAHLHNKSEDEVIEAIDSLSNDDAVLIHRCIEGFKSAMGFLAVALTGAVNAAESVQKSPKSQK